MSKAFTKEDSTEPPVRPPLRTSPAWVTAQGLKRLQQRLAELPPGDPAAPQLAARLESLTVLETVDDGRVRFGCHVTVDDGTEVKTWRIVGPDEADAQAGLLSVESPLARSLLGHRVGDEVALDRPAGRLELRVMVIRAE